MPMELNNDADRQNPVVQTFAEFSFLLVIVISISFSIELCRKLQSRKLLRKKLAFRYLLLFKVVADLLGLVSALALFSVERSIERSPDLLVSFYTCIDVCSRILTGAGLVSSLITFIYSWMRLWELTQQNIENEPANYFYSILTFGIVIVAMINMLFLKNAHPSPEKEQFVPLLFFRKVMFWVDILILALAVVLVLFTLKRWLHFFRNTNKKLTTAISVDTQQDDLTTILSNANYITYTENMKKAKQSIEANNKRELKPRTQKTELMLLLLGVVFASFLLHCISMFSKPHVFLADEAVVFSFFSTSSLIIVTMFP